MSERCAVPHRLDELEFAGCAACAWRAYHDVLDKLRDVCELGVNVVNLADSWTMDDYIVSKSSVVALGSVIARVASELPSFAAIHAPNGGARPTGDRE